MKEFEAAPPRLQPIMSADDGQKPSEFLLMHLDPSAMDDEQQTAVWTLLKYFKARGL